MIDKWDEVSVSEEFERCCSEVAAGEYVFYLISMRYSNRVLDGELTVAPRSCPCLGDCAHRLQQQHKSNKNKCVGNINSVNKSGSDSALRTVECSCSYQHPESSIFHCP